MFVDVKKAHLNAKCEEDKWKELPEECRQFGRYARVKNVVVRDAESCVRMGR